MLRRGSSGNILATFILFLRFLVFPVSFFQFFFTFFIRMTHETNASLSMLAGSFAPKPTKQEEEL
jgi:hypothetical protein